MDIIINTEKQEEKNADSNPTSLESGSFLPPQITCQVGEGVHLLLLLILLLLLLLCEF
jgi:hypothetical protein